MLVLVSWQLVEIGAIKAGKGFEFIQRARLLESFSVKFNRRMSGIDACAAAGGFLDGSRMRRAVGAEKELWVTAGGCFNQVLAMTFALQHRKAIVVRLNAAQKQGIAIEQQVMGGNGGGDIAEAPLTNSTASRVVMCSNTIRQLREALRNGDQHPVQK